MNARQRRELENVLKTTRVKRDGLREKIVDLHIELSQCRHARRALDGQIRKLERDLKC